MSFNEEAVVLDAATGQDCGRVPCCGSNVLFADNQTLATLSKTGDAVQLWNLPPNREQDLVAWTCLGAAMVLTGVWCYAQRARRSSSVTAG
jgi:hypothetical protein